MDSETLNTLRARINVLVDALHRVSDEGVRCMVDQLNSEVADLYGHCVATGEEALQGRIADERCDAYNMGYEQGRHDSVGSSQYDLKNEYERGFADGKQAGNAADTWNDAPGLMFRAFEIGLRSVRTLDDLTDEHKNALLLLCGFGRRILAIKLLRTLLPDGQNGLKMCKDYIDKLCPEGAPRKPTTGPSLPWM